MAMFSKVLIANRGEIAVRIIRACRELGIATVAVFSQADRDSLHTYMADEAMCIGSAASADSYLNVQNILNAAILKGADAIHPGFGFLSENASFANMCNECDITFIGPDSKSIEILGDKAIAKQTMMACGVPTVPGSDGAIVDFEEGEQLADHIGYPLLIKASAGGGGRGIRLVHEASQLKDAFSAAQEEAKAFFGDDSVYMERFLTNTRHIEFQILADHFGNVIHLGERECSMQRRNQKMIEESPSVGLTAKLREEMGAAAVRAAKAVGYKNTGTVEFLLDLAGNYYFMEMNTRIQVEHPVTEMVTSIDLIKQQLKIASGEKLEYKQKDIVLRGHAIECRINSEDAKNNFMPCGGTVDFLHVPGGFGVRFDSHLYQGYKLPVHYDSMLGKLIVWGNDRQEAISRMNNALNELVIEGITTNTDFQLKLINNHSFVSGNYHTGFVNEMLVNKDVL